MLAWLGFVKKNDEKLKKYIQLHNMKHRSC